MNLNDWVNDISIKEINKSIENNKNNSLFYYLYPNIYNYFANSNSLMYHYLVYKQNNLLKVELCFLDKDVNFIFEDSIFYTMDFSIQEHTLYLTIIFETNKNKIEHINLIYNLNDKTELYEISKLLYQESLNIYSLENRDGIFHIKSQKSIQLDYIFLDKLNAEINKFINRKSPVITIQEILNGSNKNMEILSNDFRKYNWVNIANKAEKIFLEEYELAWAEDMWNILMFNRNVDSSCIVCNKLDNSEYADGVLWLIAMYDIYFDYKVVNRYESYYDKDPMQWLLDIDDQGKYLTNYYSAFMDEEYEIHSLKEENKGFIVEDSECMDTDYIELVHYRDIIYDEIKNRKDFIILKIYDHFKHNYIKILEFMQGYHYLKYYFKYQQKETSINSKYENLIKKYSEGYIIYYEGSESNYFNNLDEIYEEMDYEIESLRDKGNKYIFDVEESDSYSFICNGFNY